MKLRHSLRLVVMVLVALLAFMLSPVGGSGDNETHWFLTGNAGTDPKTNFLGTTDDQALELRVYGERALRLEAVHSELLSYPYTESVNVIGGYGSNYVADGVRGGTISGGGGMSIMVPGGAIQDSPNTVVDNWGAVGGGRKNIAGSDDGDLTNSSHATVGGGVWNHAAGEFATVGGGYKNYAGNQCTIGGGMENTAGLFGCTVAGGSGNTAYSVAATIGGGGGTKSK